MQIMALPEYYLTRAEMEIFTAQTDRIIDLLGVQKETPFDLIELGAGDGSKTKKLLAALLAQGYDFDYIPVDISANVLEHLEDVLSRDLPDLTIRPQANDYFQTLETLNQVDRSKVVLYLGSNLGNLSDELAHKFIYELGANLNPGDKFLLGVDRIKPVEIVLPAYNDSQGVTAAFNLNLLHRINRELGANFNIIQFSHVAEYDEGTGVAKSFIKSLTTQTVYVSALDESFEFSEGETIQTEISRKYSQAVIKSILEGTDFKIIGVLKDEKDYFADYILGRQ